MNKFIKNKKRKIDFNLDSSKMIESNVPLTDRSKSKCYFPSVFMLIGEKNYPANIH